MDILEHGHFYSSMQFLYLVWIYASCNGRIKQHQWILLLFMIHFLMSNLCRQAFLVLISDCSCFLKYIWMLKVSHFILWNRHLSTVWIAQIKTADSDYQRIVYKSPVHGFASSSSSFAQYIKGMEGKMNKEKLSLNHIKSLYIIRKMFEDSASPLKF